MKHFFWGVFQFLMENKNRINCIFFQEVYFPKNLSELAIFGQVPLRYKSSEILCEFLPACGKLWRVAAVYGISLDCCSEMV